jgi:hypothetical protein
MNALDEIALCRFLLDVLNGPGAGAEAQHKAMKASECDLLREVGLLKDHVHAEFNSRFPKKK